MFDGLTIMLAVTAFLALLIGWQARVLAWRLNKRTKPPRTFAPSPSPVTDAADQLRIVMAATYTARPILSLRERRVFDATEACLKELGVDWRVMAQVSLGEILRASSSAAFSAVNSKRVDILLVGREGEPKAAIEYQGSGHHQGTAAARDAVKKEALRRAGIAYIEVNEGQRPSELRCAIARVCGVTLERAA